MDREAMARNQRRRLIGEAIEMEEGRETALLEQLEETVAEVEGPQLDEKAFALMRPEDAEAVRAVLGFQEPGDELVEEDSDDWQGAPADPELDGEELEAEIARLEDEIARSRARRDAYRRYVEALEG